MDSALGMLTFAAGGLAGAVFLLPARGIKGWAYETWWFVYTLSGLIAFPLLICALTVPSFWHVAMSAPGTVLLKCAGFGAMWGVGGLAWGLMVRYLGIGLGLAIGCGLCAATGTVLPPIMNGEAASLLYGPDGAVSTGKLIVLAGVATSLLGIVFVGLAGKLKEAELPESEKKKAVADFDFGKGVATALVAGIFSGGMNLGLQSGGCIEKAAVEAGADPTWRGMPVIMVVLWGGFVVQAVWCLAQHFKNRTFGDYARPTMRNILLSCAVGLLWVMQFVCTKAGEPLMGDLKYISFAVMMASTIFFSTIAGVMSGEWKGTGAKTRLSLAAGTAILLAAFCTISIGSR